ncbi:MAG TPA: GFA family protein [Caulobacteraceae bacterium]|nr:GFA family protein [Caulobacteraceae bacterium]
MTPTLPIPGGCNCGEVRYRLTGQPLTCYVCHCHLCQKRTGSAFSMQLVIPGDALEFTAGEPKPTERRLASGQRHTSRICPSCWSRISTRREGAPVVILRAGTLDDTAWLRPVAQIWTSSALPWALLPDDVLSYAEQPADFGPMVAAWSERPAT